MSSFLVAAVAALAAAVGTGLLVRDCARLPRIELIGWLVAAAGLTIALAAQALGYYGGFGATTFRAVQLGAQLLAPLGLAWGLAEVAGRSVTARFASRLGLTAVTIVAGVIMAVDPLEAVPFTRAWPAASAHYGFIANGVLTLIAAVTLLTAVIAVIAAGVRSRREPAWQGAFAVTAAGGGAAVVVLLLRLTLPLNAAYAAVCLLAAALTWFAGTRSDVQRLGIRGGPAPARVRGYREDDDYGGLYRPDDGGYPGRRDDTGWGQFGADTGYGQVGADTGYGYETGSRDISDTGYGFYRDDTGGLRAVSDTGYGLYRDDTGSMVFADGTGPLPAADTGFGLPGFGAPGAGEEEEEEGTARLYGQIAIYTLLEGRAEDFDRLAQEVVAKVKAREPETLVFVMHGVPSAPMQRILYEVYRDQAAYEHHAEQAYVREFEEQRKPFVLATNVIELGVRQAKVLPLAPGAAAHPLPEPAAPAARPTSSRPAAPGYPARARAEEAVPPAYPRSRADSQPSRAGEDAQPSLPGPDSRGSLPGADSWGSRSRGDAQPSLPGADSRPSRSRGDAQPSLPGADSRSSRSRGDAQSWPREESPPSWSGGGSPPSWPPEEPPPSRSREDSRARRSTGSARTDGDFWTRGPSAAGQGGQGEFWDRPADGRDDPDDGDFWNRGSRGDRYP